MIHIATTIMPMTGDCPIDVMPLDRCLSNRHNAVKANLFVSGEYHLSVISLSFINLVTRAKNKVIKSFDSE